MADQDGEVPTGGRILVADDEPHIRRILVTFLEAAGFGVDTVADGAAALERLRDSEPYDLMVLDILMPEASGFEVLAEVRSLERAEPLPVLILTAKGQDADREKAFDLGADAFLTKPFSPKKLLAKINEILDGR